MRVLGNPPGLCTAVTDQNSFTETEETLILYNPTWNLLRCVTDSGKNMSGAEKGLLVA